MSPFEEKLLGELKQVVAERNVAPEPVRPRWRPRLVVTASVAAALGLIAAVGIPVLTANRASPAWAVTPAGDGWVSVEIYDLRDAAGLERQLEEVGVPADIAFWPDQPDCAGYPRLTSAEERDQRVRSDHSEPGTDGYLVRPDGFEPGEVLVSQTKVVGDTRAYSLSVVQTGGEQCESN